MSLPIYEIKLGDSTGIIKMSLVDSPAVESDFLAFEKEDKKPLYFADDEKRIVLGCALRADFPIYRNQNGREFYVKFSKDVIQELYQKFMIDNRQNRVNVNHQRDVNGVYLIQSFIKDSNMGISPKGFEDIEDGSWFVAYKIKNSEIWKGVKNGTYNGFSIESITELVPENTVNEIPDLIDELLTDKRKR